MQSIILSPENYNFQSDYDWREFLKKELLKKRNFKSDLSGLPVSFSSGCDLHEGILTRANVPQGIKWHRLIYHEYNCFILLRDEHIPCPPSRSWCIAKAYERYGREEVRQWFYALPFKRFPFQLP